MLTLTPSHARLFASTVCSPEQGQEVAVNPESMPAKWLIENWGKLNREDPARLLPDFRLANSGNG